MSDTVIVFLSVFFAFTGALSLAEWAANHWVQAQRQRE
jgi:hypothetical protein